MIELNKNEQKGMTERNIQRMRFNLNNAKNDRLKMNQELCGWHLLAPANKRTSTNIYFYGIQIGFIENGEIELINMEHDVWKGKEWKRDGFVFLVNEVFTETIKLTVDDTAYEITKESIEPVTNEDVSDGVKPKPKRKTPKRKPKKKA